MLNVYLVTNFKRKTEFNWNCVAYVNNTKKRKSPTLKFNLYYRL